MSSSSVESQAASVLAQVRAPATASRQLIEYAVLGVAGLGDLRERLVAESNDIARRARRRVTQLLRERFGGRRPQLSGWHSCVVFILTFAAVIPIGLFGASRFGGDSTEAAAAAALAVGASQLTAALLTWRKPVPRSSLIQAQVSTVLMVGVALAGVTTGATGSWCFLGAAAASALALGIYALGRSDPGERQRIDEALESASLDVAVEVSAERARMLESLAAELQVRRVDVAQVRALRSASIAAFQRVGNPVVDDAPHSLPGFYLILGHSEAWLPPSHRADETAAQ